jgi:glycosyltransferase involved in cell wall biosynthesis
MPILRRLTSVLSHARRVSFQRFSVSAFQLFSFSPHVLTRRLYYWVKPFFSRRVQIAFRRFHASRVLKRSGDIWPIKPSAARKPGDWPGWPENKQFGLILTHDVEGAAGVDRVKQLAELEMKHGFRSSFNFVPEGGYIVPPDLRTWLTERGFEVGVQDLHHDAKLYRSRKHFAESARRINRYIHEWDASGFRSAFMLHNLEWLHDLDVLYDASTFDTDPFEPQPDGMDTIFPFWVDAGGAAEEQRRGAEQESRSRWTSRLKEGESGGPLDPTLCPTPTPGKDDRGQRTEDGTQGSTFLPSTFLPSAFDPRPSTLPAGRGGYVELPYTLVQDFNLFIILQAKTIDIWKRKFDWIVQHDGMVLLDTHPDYMAFGGAQPQPIEYPAELYEELLTYARDKYEGAYWHALPREVAAYVVETRGKRQRTPSDPLNTGAAAVSEAASPSTVLPSVAFSKSASQAQGRSQESSDGARENLEPPGVSKLRGKRAAVLLFSHYPADPRPRRAAEALIAEGVSIDLICLQENESEPSSEMVNGVQVTRVPLRRNRGSKLSYIAQYSAFILTAFGYLATRSVNRRYDIVHVHNMPDVLVFSALVPKLLGAKVILDLHDPMPELMRTIFKLPEESFGVAALKRLEKWSIAFADSVLTVNLACKKIYSSRSCRPEKINVVLNSPDENIFAFRQAHPHGANGNGASRPFHILFHGSLVHRNGFDLAVDALEGLQKTVPGAKLMVCGQRTPYFDSVMESAEARGLSSHVDYLGARSLEQIVEAINRCDLGIIPNHRNIFTEINTPTRIFEYLALGKPVIAPRAQGIQDYFGDNDLIFFELGDADDLARKIEFAFKHRTDVDEIVRRGQAVYRAHMWSREKAVLLKAVGELV